MAVEERDAAAEEAAAEAQPEETAPEGIDASFVPRPREDVSGISIDGEGVLLVESLNSVHYMNQTSTVIWESLDGESTLEHIATDLSDTFKAERETVLNDVIDAVRRFGNASLLEGVVPKMIVGPGGAAPSRLDVGTEVPGFELPDLEGQTVTMESLRGEQILLVNWSATCGFCKRIAPDFAELDPALREQGIRPVFISIGSAEANREVLDEVGLALTLLLQGDDRVEVFEGLGTPAAYLVDENGVVASELAYGSEEVPRLLKTAAGVSEEAESEDQVNYVRRL